VALILTGLGTTASCLNGSNGEYCNTVYKPTCINGYAKQINTHAYGGEEIPHMHTILVACFTLFVVVFWHPGSWSEVVLCKGSRVPFGIKLMTFGISIMKLEGCGVRFDCVQSVSFSLFPSLVPCHLPR
jgi:hypothetical protein